MNKQDLMYTNCREIEYEADSHTQKSILYGIPALMLEIDSPTMGGMDCLVAYIITDDHKKKFDDSAWDMSSSIEDIIGSYHVNFEHDSRAYLESYLEQGCQVIILEEQRSYLMASSEKGASRLVDAETQRLVKTIANPIDSDHYHFSLLPALYENFGRVTLNYRLFMSGFKA